MSFWPGLSEDGSSSSITSLSNCQERIDTIWEITGDSSKVNRGSVHIINFVWEIHTRLNPFTPTRSFKTIIRCFIASVAFSWILVSGYFLHTGIAMFGRYLHSVLQCFIKWCTTVHSFCLLIRSIQAYWNSLCLNFKHILLDQFYPFRYGAVGNLYRILEWAASMTELSNALHSAPIARLTSQYQGFLSCLTHAWLASGVSRILWFQYFITG